MYTIRLFLPVVLCICMQYYVQSQSVGIGTNSPSSSAQLDISSNSKGILIPRLTTTQRNQISTPANGLMIYNITDQQFNFFNGTNWQTVNGLPKGSIVLGKNFNDSTMKKEGFSQKGYLTLNITEQTTADTVMPANSWYAGNRLDAQNATAPQCGQPFFAGYTGTEFFVFTFRGVFSYNLQTDKWVKKNAQPDEATAAIEGDGTMVWTGAEFLFWGGGYDSYFSGTFPNWVFHPANYASQGIRYNPAANSWIPISTTNAPTPRKKHKAVWTGSELVIWGGLDSAGIYKNTGARYHPTTNTWSTMPVPAAFSGRSDFTMTAAGANIVIWGGKYSESRTRTFTDPCSPPNTVTLTYDSVANLRDGRVYNLAANSWLTMPLLDAPALRHHAAAVWDGYQLVVAGGTFTKVPELYCGSCPVLGFPFGNPCPKIRNVDSSLASGATYNPASNKWTPIPGAPKAFTNATGLSDEEQFMHFFGADTILSYEPSAGDWYKNLIPPLSLFDNANINQRQYVWKTSAPGSPITDLVAIPKASCASQVYVLSSVPVLLQEVRNTVNNPNALFYLYQKE
ncbi:MAG: hypothetical protein V4722_11065 [Bacteroidota bacterium]